jgi:hypothetical protein
VADRIAELWAELGDLERGPGDCMRRWLRHMGTRPRFEHLDDSSLALPQQLNRGYQREVNDRRSRWEAVFAEMQELRRRRE